MLAHRTTFSLDQDTVDGIRRLAASWDTSQAGAVRKAIALALGSMEQPLGVAEVLAQYRAGAVPRSTEQTQALSVQLRDERQAMESSRMQRLPAQWRDDS